MPIVQLTTNVDEKEFPADFNLKFLEVLSGTLRYEVWRFFPHVSNGQNCTSGGTDQPSALIRVRGFNCSRTTRELTSDRISWPPVR